MRITFVLPSFASVPIGGFKVIYEHANGLVGRGHDVRLIHPRTIEPSRTLLDRAKSPLWRHKIAWHEWRNRGWFSFDKRIQRIALRWLSERRIPDGDVVVATSWRTANFVNSLPQAKGRPFYFVQDYEYWRTASSKTRTEMSQTFHLGVPMISISSVVSEMLAENGVEPLATIHSGADHDVFRLCQGPEDRPAYSFGFPVRPEEFKGTADAIDAAETIRRHLGAKLQVHAFGARSGASLPEWIQYLDSPPNDQLCRFYNRISVFLLPSWFEGWGLPGVEALACGAALVTTDCGGIRDYADHERTALVVPPKRPDLMAQAIIRLFDNPKLRYQLARAGNERVRQFSWKTATDSLENILTMSQGRKR